MERADCDKLSDCWYCCVLLATALALTLTLALALHFAPFPADSTTRGSPCSLINSPTNASAMSCL
ncbi:hypothetical protein GMOD_00005550 [Pyrenophora seminiperda CCB06]|uniref:Uncharacterized protein n=1 Tax=Pyrenophora seminiperda CCB06 TaxID=1302712 RepID=A0A3M7M974_9PLEO|nr:hypothetical protein GMOD_00005550 [Pyrenophora seminiperda CCB06]